MDSNELKAEQDKIKKSLKEQIRALNRQGFHADMEIKKAQKKLEAAVKKGEDKSLQQMYAKNVLAARKNKEKLLAQQTKIQDCQYGIDNMFTNIKMGKTLGDTSAIMKKIGGLVNIQEISKTAAEMGMNLQKMGVLGEMVDDAMDEQGDDDMDEDSPEVDGLLEEIQGKVDPNKYKTGQKLQAEEQNDANFDDMLNDLKI